MKHAGVVPTKEPVAVEYVPGEQSPHVVEVATYLPAPQYWQPFEDERYLPVGQPEQLEEEVAPVPVFVVPGAQSVQLDAPEAAHVPMLQVVQDVRPVRVCVEEPAAHGVHATLPAVAL